LDSSVTLYERSASSSSLSEVSIRVYFNVFSGCFGIVLLK